MTIFVQLQLLMVTIDASITGGTEPCHQIKLYLLVFLLDSLSEDYLFLPKQFVGECPFNAIFFADLLIVAKFENLRFLMVNIVARLTAGTDLWPCVHLYNGVAQFSSHVCSTTAVLCRVPQGYRSDLSDASSKHWIGDCSGFGIHSLFFAEATDRSNELQVIEDRAEMLPVFSFRRLWSNLDKKRADEVQWEMCNWKSNLGLTPLLANMASQASTRSTSGPMHPVFDSDKEAPCEKLRTSYLNHWVQVCTTVDAFSWGESQETKLGRRRPCVGVPVQGDGQAVLE